MATVLVVDDCAENRELLAVLLGYCQHRVLEAGDGREALVLAAEHRPDLIISDILMPSMDGYEFVHRLRDLPAMAATPVIFSTAHCHDREAKALAHACGVTHIVYKPIEPYHLLRLTEEILTGGGAAMPLPLPLAPETGDAFEERHRRLLGEQLLAKNADLQAANRRLSGLLDFGLALGRQRAPATVLSDACRVARTLIGARIAACVLVDVQGFATAETTAGRADTTTPLFVGQRIAAPFAEVLATGEPARLTGLHLGGLPPALGGVAHLLVAPIRSRDASQGFICLADKVGLAAFDANEEDLLRMIGGQVGVVLDNLRFYEELSSRAKRLEREAAERQRAEEALRRSEREAQRARDEAERANLAKSKFFAAASHDLRQPFQAMRLFHEVLTSRLTESPQRVAAARLEEAMRAGEELLGTLLDVASLDAGTCRVKIEPVPASEIILKVLAECEPQAWEKGLRLRHIPSTAIILTDEALFARILRGLVHNAIRYTRHGGILVGCRRRGGTTCVEVWDTGVGIPADQLAMIFEDYHQIDNEARESKKGLGLGLSVVSRAARLLGHTVAVRSRPQRGSVFSVAVPSLEPPGPAAG